VVIAGEHEELIISTIQEIPQVSYIYILSEQNVPHEKWNKVLGIYRDITSICNALRQTTNQSLDVLESSFMYTQILKEILLNMDFEKVHFDKFIRYFRERWAGHKFDLEKLDRVEKEYHKSQPVRWYTSERFFSCMLNGALRQMDTIVIVNMGFFVRDLHENIVKLHFEQYAGQNPSQSFIAYRGQCLTQNDFNQLRTLSIQQFPLDQS
jgi:hypothetical protein